MGGKQKTNSSTNSVKVGTRVRFAEDGVEGRIVWANATTVKIKWDDGETINWKREKLAEKGVEVLDDDQDQGTAENTETPAEQATTEPASEQATPTEPTVEEQPVEQPATDTDSGQTETTANTEQKVEVETTTPEALATEPAHEATPEPKKKRAPKQPKEPKPKKLSALDAAARLLEETGQPMNCKAMVEEMGKRGMWSSPNGATPDATLYAAIIREIRDKGVQARFTKTDRGTFAFRAAAAKPQEEIMPQAETPAEVPADGTAGQEATSEQ